MPPAHGGQDGHYSPRFRDDGLKAQVSCHDRTLQMSLVPQRVHSFSLHGVGVVSGSSVGRHFSVHAHTQMEHLVFTENGDKPRLSRRQPGDRGARGA